MIKKKKGTQKAPHLFLSHVFQDKYSKRTHTGFYPAQIHVKLSKVLPLDVPKSIFLFVWLIWGLLVFLQESYALTAAFLRSYEAVNHESRAHKSRRCLAQQQHLGLGAHYQWRLGWPQISLASEQSENFTSLA